MAVVLIFFAAFAAVALGGWIIYALTHPVAAGQGILIFLCKAAGRDRPDHRRCVLARSEPAPGSATGPVHGRFLLRREPAGTPLAALVDRP